MKQLATLSITPVAPPIIAPAPPIPAVERTLWGVDWAIYWQVGVVEVAAHTQGHLEETVTEQPVEGAT